MYSPGVEPMKLLLAVREMILCMTEEETEGEDRALPRREDTYLCKGREDRQVDKIMETRTNVFDTFCFYKHEKQQSKTTLSKARANHNIRINQSKEPVLYLCIRMMFIPIKFPFKFEFGN